MRQELPMGSLRIVPSPIYDGKDLARLVVEVAANGVARPFLVTPDLSLLHRHREAGACRLLDFKTVPVYIVDVERLIKEPAEAADFLPTEAVVIGRLVEEHQRPIAEKHRLDGRLRGSAARNGKPVDRMDPEERFQVRDVAAAAVGLSVTTYSRAREVVLAAEADPEHFGDLPALMDSSTIAGIHRELRRRQVELNPPSEAPPPPPARKAPGSTVKVVTGKGPVQVVQNTMYSLIAAANLLDDMSPDDLPPDLAESWADDLSGVGRSLARFRHRLNDRAKEHMSAD